MAETEEEQRQRWLADDAEIVRLGRPTRVVIDKITDDIESAIETYDSPWTPGIARELVHAHNVLTEWTIYTWPVHEPHEVSAETCEMGGETIDAHNTCVLHAVVPPDDSNEAFLDTISLLFRHGYAHARYGHGESYPDKWIDKTPALRAAYETGVTLGALVKSGQVSDLDPVRGQGHLLLRRTLRADT